MLPPGRRPYGPVAGPGFFTWRGREIDRLSIGITFASDMILSGQVAGGSGS